MLPALEAAPVLGLLVGPPLRVNPLKVEWLPSYAAKSLVLGR
jgi:hypothetical protein